jgi:uncharacterized protein
MKVTFDQISAGNCWYSIKDTAWFPVEELILRQFHHSLIDLLKENNETVVLKGEMLVSVQFFCDRCGEPFDFPLAAEFLYNFKIGEDTSLLLQEKECGEEDCNTVYLDEPVIDIGEILREQVLLAAPVRRICDEGCRGLCPGCGKNLGREACTCSPGRSESPFAVLKNLKKY